MEIVAAYDTNVGNVKEINQDSLSLKVVNSPKGKIVLAIVCDGMGGLEQGELASKEVIVAFHNWFATWFAQDIINDTFFADRLRNQWQDMVDLMNEKLKEYASRQGMMMGTTLSVLLIYQQQYYVCHVGDSRVYRIANRIDQVTEDHSLVAQEVRLGILSQEEAEKDPRRSVLLQCVGASDTIEMQFETGNIEQPTTFVLSSDGFVHMLSEEELFNAFEPTGIEEKQQLTQICQDMTHLVMERGEKDNVSVVAVVVK